MLVALHSVASEQVNITQSTSKSVTHLIKFAATHSEYIVKYYSNVMVLHINSDTSSLSEPESKSRAGGYNYLNTKLANSNKAPLKQSPHDVPVHIKYTIM